MAGLPQLVGAVQLFAHDTYSQARRFETGYSDCSSFICKGMQAIGIKYPPGGGTTTAFMASPDWQVIPRSDLMAGDICVNVTHMVLATSNSTAIGQERPHVNVRTGSVENLMSSTGAFKCMRYVGTGIARADYSTGNATPVGLTDIPASLTHAAQWLSDTTNWFRTGMVILGALLLGIAVVGFEKSAAIGKAVVHGKP
jgi:hypothetical protein